MLLAETEVDLACALCGVDAWMPLVEAPDFEYACAPGTFALNQCAGCGHVRVRDMPDPESIAALYPPTYYTINPNSPLYLRGFVYRKKSERDAKRLTRLIEERGAETIVDLGCGDAVRLFKCAQHFKGRVNLIGVDLAFEEHVKKRGSDCGVTLVEGNAETDLSALPFGGCDLIIMTQLIEHLTDPRGAMERLYENLSPGGCVLIETPNLGGLDHQLFRRRYWGGYHIPRHLHLFNQANLARLVNGCGYEVIEQGYLPSPGFWIITLRNALGLSSASRGRRFWEFLNFANLPVVAAFTAFDTLRIKLGMPTSNQYLLARKPQ